MLLKFFLKTAVAIAGLVVLVAIPMLIIEWLADHHHNLAAGSLALVCIAAVGSGILTLIKYDLDRKKS